MRCFVNINGGGVCTAIICQIQETECLDLSSELEAIWVQIHSLYHTPIYICSLYRPPDKDPDYINLLRKPLEHLLNRHKNKLPHVIIAGDINYGHIDWSTSSTNFVSNGSNFVDILNDYFLNQLVNSPTRFSATTSSILDLVISSHPTLIDNLVIGRELSDHSMISFDIALRATLAESLPRKIFVYSKGNYAQLR